MVAVALSAGIVVPGRAARVRWRRLLGEVSTPRADRFLTVSRLQALLPAIRRPIASGVTLVASVVGLILAGPVAGAVLATYGATATSLAHRAGLRRTEARSRVAAVAAVSMLAAELRAGIDVGSAMAEAERCLIGPTVVGNDAATVGRRVAAAVEVAEASGAPLADVLDRLDSHLRAVDRARATAAAQAAGARASALLLAAMPVGGLSLGFLVGVDSVGVLLHTPLGSACLAGSAVLQLGGLAWAARLSRVDVRA